MTRAEVMQIIDRPQADPPGFDPIRHMDSVVERTIRSLQTGVDDVDLRRAQDRNERRAARWHAERSRR